jgi:hypothetical protein
MARGWESKSVEQQQADRSEQPNPARPAISPKQQERNRKRQGLLLSRSRLLQQLHSASHPRHRQMIERSIAALDAELARLEEVARG